MSKLRDTTLVYRERLILCAIAAILYLALTPYSKSPVALAARPAISTWISSTIFMNALMSLLKASRDPLTHTFGMPTRVLEVIFLVAGLITIAAATWYGSPGIGTWGCLSLLFSLDGVLCERESWRRYRLEQRQEEIPSV